MRSSRSGQGYRTSGFCGTPPLVLRNSAHPGTPKKQPEANSSVRWSALVSVWRRGLVPSYVSRPKYTCSKLEEKLLGILPDAATLSDGDSYRRLLTGCHNFQKLINLSFVISHEARFAFLVTPSTLTPTR